MKLSDRGLARKVDNNKPHMLSQMDQGWQQEIAKAAHLLTRSHKLGVLVRARGERTSSADACIALPSQVLSAYKTLQIADLLISSSFTAMYSFVCHHCVSSILWI